MTSIDGGKALRQGQVTVDLPADDMNVALVAMRRIVRVMAGDVARLAGEIAGIMEQVAAQRERLATTFPDRAGELRAAAERARRFAEHERGEQGRWLGYALSSEPV